MHELLIVMAFFWWPFSMQQSIEKQALAIAQRVPVNDLDAALPRSPFSNWFEKVVGQKSGVIWQLGECGRPVFDPTLASTQDSPQPENRDIAACVEANAVLPDGLKVVVMIEVGTFKKGLSENPGFNLAMIEQEGDLYMIRRLSELPVRLHALIEPAGKPLFLPEVFSTPRLIVSETMSSRSLAPMKKVMLPGDNGTLAPPPPNVLEATARAGGSAEKAVGSVTWANAITTVQPRYPPAAKKVNAAGTVEVKITISELGRVIEAKAISGSLLLKGAAEEAARQWVFKPATLKGSPMASQRILTFVFKAPQ